MTKVELADKVFEWLKSDEKTMTASIKGIATERTMMFIKIPYGKKPMSEVCTVIYGEITDMDDWCGTRNFSRAGFWVPKKEVLLEDPAYGYHFNNVNSHFIDEGNLIEQFKEISKRDIFDYYHEKYPTIESLGIDIDNSDTMKAIRTKLMDLDWMDGSTPDDVWGYFNKMAYIGWGMCNITDAMCIRYLNGEETILRDLFTSPYIDESNADMRGQIEDIKRSLTSANADVIRHFNRSKIESVKRSLASAYEYNELRKTYKPSTHAITTKKIVDAVNAFVTKNKGRKIQNFRVSGVLDNVGTISCSIGSSKLKYYEAVYDGIDCCWRKNADSEVNYDDLLPENVLKISYGRKVIYSKGE